MDSKPKYPAPIVVLARILVWLMLLNGALILAVGMALVGGALDFPSVSHRGASRFLLQCFGFPVAFAGALNILSAVLFFRLSTASRLWVYLALVLNVFLCLVAALGYLIYISIRRDFSSLVLWWYCYLAANVLLAVVLRHPSVVSWCRAGRARRRTPASGFPVITDER